MSLGVYIDCDGCGDTLTAAPVGGGALLRAEARKHGWHVRLNGGLDLCDECWRRGWRVVREGSRWVRFFTGKQRVRSSPDSGTD